VYEDEKECSVVGFDGGNIVAREQGGACEIIPILFIRNVLRNVWETVAR
jgi:hypothetical protein